MPRCRERCTPRPRGRWRAALHRAYALGWVGATVASGLLLLLPLPLQTRTVVALLCGPMVGIGVHLVALARAGRLTG